MRHGNISQPQIPNESVENITYQFVPLAKYEEEEEVRYEEVSFFLHLTRE